ncbi:splicing factor, CC1-like protein [Coemansia reversa NRRL 1564]|uniref:Splicing factor, CC1-like protein n=1 Tax=Coemansia reversa (strain ATCC 12441 / NRRL 1564) TaxID=763665 RepID=A0A2G5BAB2_COERN|nr:splicing factor, CC1-like protein [Coemansia reversa NRRL 1564]|eukprot:PIA15948.1 splicing factor, CC1-like protein [Coemansia reversa NRRL 1564]
MAEEIDVDALLDAPFKNSKVVEEQKTSTEANVSSTIKAKQEAASEVSREDVHVAKVNTGDDSRSTKNCEPISQRESLSRVRARSPSRSSQSRHRSSRLRHHSSRSRHRYEDEHDEYYRRYAEHRRRRMDDSPRDYDRDRYRDYDRERYNNQSPRRESSRRRSSSPPTNTFARSRSVSLERRYRRRSRGSRSPSPEVNESERDLRTIFAMQLSARLRRSDLVDFFSRAGRVRDAQIVSEKGSRRSRGVAYVEFYAIDSAIKAVALSGERLLGVPIIVQPSEAEKNRRSTNKQYSTDGAPVGASDPENCLVFIRELLVNIAPSDMQQFFDLFGVVDYCHVESAPVAPSDPHGDPEWVAFVRFDAPAPAHHAAEKLNGLKLFGTRLRVRMARKSEQEYEQRRIAKQKKNQQQEDAGEETAAAAADDDDDSTAMVVSPEIAINQGAVHASPTEPRRVLLLKNMVDPREETEPNWRDELSEDVKGECLKFGRIVRVNVSPGMDGDIFVHFADAESAERARQSMNARWFGGRKIEAELLVTTPHHQQMSSELST